jgi:hypothetical protein
MSEGGRDFVSGLDLVADQFRLHWEFLRERLPFLWEFGLSEGNVSRLERYARAAADCEALGRGAVLASGCCGLGCSEEGRQALELRGLELAFWAGRYGRLCERVLREAPRVARGGASPFTDGGDDDGSSR